MTSIDEPWPKGTARPPEVFTDSVNGVAHVGFHVTWDLPGHGVVPFPPELQIATTQFVGGEWKLLLDEWSDLGLPGFRDVGFWIDESSTTKVATDD